jgi:hypothetical protein
MGNNAGNDAVVVEDNGCAGNVAFSSFVSGFLKNLRSSFAPQGRRLCNTFSGMNSLIGHDSLDNGSGNCAVIETDGSSLGFNRDAYDALTQINLNEMLVSQGNVDRQYRRAMATMLPAESTSDHDLCAQFSTNQCKCSSSQ